MTWSTQGPNIKTTHGGPPPLYYAIHFLPPIKPTPMGKIVPGLTNFDESIINKSNATLELWKLRSQDLMFFISGPPYLIDNGRIDARCSKDAIIIYSPLAPIP
jgi:hypothetical protein